MKRTLAGIALILLSLALFALLALRYAPGAPLAAASAAPAVEAAPEPSPSPAATPEPPSPTEAATPEPSPTPEPTPSPRPLLEAALSEEGIDAALFAPCAEAGTLLRDVAYTTQDYIWREEGEKTKLMQIYLPYGYDEAGHYDVLFLIHTRQLNERFWLEQEHRYRRPDGSAGSGSTVALLDNMIARGLCKPMIVVSLNGYLDEGRAALHVSEQVYPQFREEFALDILPFVAGRCTTWAEGTTHEALSAARRHFGLFGASFGAYETELSVLAPNLELVSWYAMTGGGSVTRDYLEPMWAMYGTLGLPIDLLYLAEGEYDDRAPVENSYTGLGAWSEVFTPEENLRFTLLRGVGHEEAEWMTALYNTLQLMFR